MNFWDQYKHPEWQKKRLECLAAADWTCQCCFDQGSELHVHHRAYIKGRMVWEYEASELEVLCDACHSYAHSAKDALNGLVSRIPVDALSEIIGLICGFALSATGPISNAVIDEKSIVEFTTKHNQRIGEIAGFSQLLTEKSLGELVVFIDQLAHKERTGHAENKELV